LTKDEMKQRDQAWKKGNMGRLKEKKPFWAGGRPGSHAPLPRGFKVEHSLKSPVS